MQVAVLRKWEQTVGVLLLSDDGAHAEGRLVEGEGDAPSAVLHDLVRRGEHVYPVMSQGALIVRRVRPGEPGFMAAVLQQLRPPFGLGFQGRVQRFRTVTLSDTTAVLWRQFATGEPPPHRPLA